MNKYFLMTLVFFLLGLTTNVFSQPEERSDNPHSRLDRMVNHLDLDDTQKSNIREIFDESRSDFEDIG
ncbi:uncharacterized protein METZ01_LOCUS143154, partial [marine metagenome]